MLYHINIELSEEFARKHKLMYIETSAKTSKNVEDAFITTANSIYRKIDNVFFNTTNDANGIRRGNKKLDNSMKNKCCT